MCYGENNALHASHYVNAQLKALWENAVECATRQGTDLSLDEIHRYSFALAQFSFGKLRSRGAISPADFQFFASFGAPELEFACNHDVILHLRITDGHYRSDITTPAYVYQTILAHLLPYYDFSSSLVKIDKTVSFRIPFRTSGIQGGDDNIGSRDHVIKLVVLNYSSAYFGILSTATLFDSLSQRRCSYLQLAPP